jgi:endonuclease YncB( thermonuclease family)
MTKRFTLTLILALIAWGWISPAADADSLRVKVHWVDDGDTIVVAGGERVRYLGINTPEVANQDKPAEPFANEAKAFNKKLVQGRWINLELTKQQRDHYGRLLAFVFLADGTFVNGELVRRGYAHLLGKQQELPYWKQLLEFQRQALKEKKGMWSLPVVKPEKFYIANKVIELDSEIVTKLCTMDSALAVAVNPKSSASHSNSKYETDREKRCEMCDMRCEIQHSP